MNQVLDFQTMVYEPVYLDPKELVGQDIYEALGPKGVLGAYNPYLLMWADWMRDRYGPVYVNTWGLANSPFDQIFDGSGFRAMEDPDYMEGSMHSIWKALDLKFVTCTAEHILKDLQKYQDDGFRIPYINRIEKTYRGLNEEGETVDKVPTWIHGDMRGVRRGTAPVDFFNA